MKRDEQNYDKKYLLKNTGHKFYSHTTIGWTRHQDNAGLLVHQRRLVKKNNFINYINDDCVILPFSFSNPD